MTVTMRLVQKCHLSQPLSVFVSLALLFPPLSLSLYFSHFMCLIHTWAHTHTCTEREAKTGRKRARERKRQNVFISPLYAVCAQPEIAGLTPHCELHRGNVYSNPKEHAINLFLDRRQTIMSLHEGNKDRTPIQDHHDNHLIMKLREVVRSQGARSPRDTFSTVYQCV